MNISPSSFLYFFRGKEEGGGGWRITAKGWQLDDNSRQHGRRLVTAHFGGAKATWDIVIIMA